MEKIHINEYIKQYKNKYSVLVEEFGYQITDLTEQSSKVDNHKIHKIQYINTSKCRMIEVVLISENYETHMFSRYCDTYFKKIDSISNIPDYVDVENCYNLYDISELTPGLNIHTDTDLLLKSVSKILIGEFWPINTTLSKLKSIRLGFETKAGYRPPPYISEIKSTLNELIINDFEVLFDENNVPPYEQSFMGPELRYGDKKTGTIYRIYFQTRDQEFYVSRNSDSNWFYGIATQDKYDELKKKILLTENRHNIN